MRARSGSKRPAMSTNSKQRGRDAWLGVRLSQADRAAIKARADGAGLTVSEFVRRRCTEDRDGPVVKVDTAELKKTHADLRRAGGLLNQVARELNARHRPDRVEAALERSLEAVATASEDVSKLISDARRV